MGQKITLKRYSQAFKQQVVKEYEAGAGVNELRRKYGIGGGSTIQGWIKQYGREGTRHQLMVIQSPQEQNQVKVLKKRVAQLEQAVTQLTLDKLMLEASLAEAEAQLGEPVKKKDVAKSLNGPTNTVNNKAGR
jgi:transposase-like protein